MLCVFTHQQLDSYVGIVAHLCSLRSQDSLTLYIFFTQIIARLVLEFCLIAYLTPRFVLDGFNAKKKVARGRS